MFLIIEKGRIEFRAFYFWLMSFTGALMNGLAIFLQMKHHFHSGSLASNVAGSWENAFQILVGFFFNSLAAEIIPLFAAVGVLVFHGILLLLALVLCFTRLKDASVQWGGFKIQKGEKRLNIIRSVFLCLTVISLVAVINMSLRFWNGWGVVVLATTLDMGLIYTDWAVALLGGRVAASRNC